MFNRFRKSSEQYTHNPIPFDDVRGKSIQPSSSQPATKSWGDYGFSGYDLNSVTRYQDLGTDNWGLSIAITANIAAYACTEVRASKVGNMAWEIKRRSDGEILEKSDTSAPRHPLSIALLQARKLHRTSLFYLWQYGKSIYGEAFIEKVLNVNQLVSGLYWWNPLYVTFDAPRGIIEGYRYSGYDGYRDLSEWRVAYDRYMHSYEPNRGFSPLEAAITEINQHRAMQTEVQSFIRRGMRPSALISPSEGNKFNQEDGEFIQRFLQEKMVGAQNAYRPLIAPKNVDVTILQPPKFEDQSWQREMVDTAIHKAFRVPKSMTGDAESTRYQANSNEDEWFFDNFIKPECDGVAQTVNLEILPYFDNSGEFEFAFNYEAYDFVTETEEKRAALVRDDFSRGLMSFNEARIARGEKPIDITTGQPVKPGETTDYYFLESVGWIPANEVQNVWRYRLGQGTTPAFGDTGQVPLNQELGSQTPIVPEQPSPTANLNPDDIKDADTPSLTVMLDLSDNPDLVSLQRQVKSYVGDIPCEWNEPSDFHLTLISVPSIDEAQRMAIVKQLETIELPEFNLNIGSLKVFQNVGKYALHFRIRGMNSDLYELQESLYDLFQENGIALSSFSTPGTFTPHITMGYASQKPPTATFHTKVRVSPKGLVVKDGSVVFARVGIVEDETPEPPVTPAEVPSKAAQSGILDELRAWKKKSVNNPSKPFETYHIGTEIADCIRADIAHATSNKAILSEVFDLWQAALKSNVIIVKSFNETKTRYMAEIERQFKSAVSERINRSTFINRMTILHERYSRQLWIDGQSDGGIEDYTFDDEPDDEKWVSNFVQSQEGYFAGVADQLYADEKLTEDELKGKPEIWFNKSLYPVYLESLGRAAKNMLMEWVLGKTEMHCRSCLALNGQKRTMKFWQSRIVPKSSELACNGFNCDCELVPTRGKKNRGDLPVWKSVHEH